MPCLQGQSDGESRTLFLGKDLPSKNKHCKHDGDVSRSWHEDEILILGAQYRTQPCGPLHFVSGHSHDVVYQCKGASKRASVSALVSLLKRLNNNFSTRINFLARTSPKSGICAHYPNEKWFALTKNAALPTGMLDDYCLEYL